MSYGVDGKNMDVLRSLRSELIENTKVESERIRKDERWNVFQKTAAAISESINDQDLENLVSHVRKMKNLLRRPSVKKDLARLETEETSSSKKSDSKNKPNGNCKCSKCGKTVDGYRECVEGALCPNCALKNRSTPPGEESKEKAEKKAKKGTAFPPEMVGMGGAGVDTTGDTASDTTTDTSQKTPPPKEKTTKDVTGVPVKTSKKKDKKKKKKRFDDEDNMPPKKKKTESRLRRRRVTFHEDY